MQPQLTKNYVTLILLKTQFIAYQKLDGQIQWQPLSIKGEQRFEHFNTVNDYNTPLKISMII